MQWGIEVAVGATGAKQVMVMMMRMGGSAVMMQAAGRCETVMMTMAL